MPFGADNALIKAAESVRRLSEYRPAPHLDEIWGAQVASMDVPDEIRDGLVNPASIWSTLESLPTPVARTCHACTHTTFSPNVAHGGQKTTIIPVGPYHPLQEEPEFFKLYVEGEKVVGLDIELGYNHRGIEKLSESKDYEETIFLVERICGICSTSHPM